MGCGERACRRRKEASFLKKKYFCQTNKVSAGMNLLVRKLKSFSEKTTVGRETLRMRICITVLNVFLIIGSQAKYR